MPLQFPTFEKCHSNYLYRCHRTHIWSKIDQTLSNIHHIFCIGRNDPWHKITLFFLPCSSSELYVTTANSQEPARAAAPTAATVQHYRHRPTTKRRRARHGRNGVGHTLGVGEQLRCRLRARRGRRRDFGDEGGASETEKRPLRTAACSTSTWSEEGRRRRNRPTKPRPEAGKKGSIHPSRCVPA
jgi:hypothetical protein